MAAGETRVQAGGAARAAKLRLLYREAGVRVGAILAAPRTPPALRTDAKRTLARLTAKRPESRAAGSAAERTARLRALIAVLTRLIDRSEGQTAGVRAVAGLKKLRTQAQALLAQEQRGSGPQEPGRKKKAAPKKMAAKRPVPKKAAGTRKAVKKAAKRSPAARKTAPRPVRKNGGRPASKKLPARDAPAVGRRPIVEPFGPDAAALSRRGVPQPPPVAMAITGVEPAPSEPEPVLLGVSAPRAVKPGAAFIARFAAYIKAVEAELEKKLAALGGGGAEVHLGIPPDESARWPVGTPVTVRASGDGFSVEPAQSRFVWSGTQNVVSFVVKTAAALAEGSAILSFEVYIEGIRVAFVPIPIEIAARPVDGEQKVTANPARTAFASYASHDRDRVLDKLGALSAYDKGLKVFTDCLDMRPGETWKQRLEAEIPNSDLFLLFWSRAASASQWVAWEWRTALDRKGLAAIQPMPLEAPQVAPPPAELSSLHFNDIYLLVREAELARRPPQ